MGVKPQNAVLIYATSLGLIVNIADLILSESIKSSGVKFKHLAIGTAIPMAAILASTKLLKVE